MPITVPHPSTFSVTSPFAGEFPGFLAEICRLFNIIRVCAIAQGQIRRICDIICEVRTANAAEGFTEAALPGDTDLAYWNLTKETPEMRGRSTP